ncbi:MAG: sensor histidine kinase [Candidatus Nanopelagicales bacterium]
MPPDQLPVSLLESASPTGAMQRFRYSGDPYLAIAIPLRDALYVEVFPLVDLDTLLVRAAWLLLFLTLALAAFGAILGAQIAARVLHPLTALAVSARRIAMGDFGERMTQTGDPDLDPIAAAFNEMVQAVQAKIARERRFAANVSHELRSPVTAALGSAEILAGSRNQLDPRTREVADVLVDQVRRMSRALVDLLEISSTFGDDGAQSEVIDVRAVCQDVLQMRGLDSRLLVGPSCFALSDARRLERILTNLVDNALLHAGGVTAIRLEPNAQCVLVHVDDQGPGIPDEVAAHVFEPFTRGPHSAATPGSGLGLAIASEQARVIGAAVNFEPLPGGGSRFTVSLPASDLPVETVEE